MSNEIFPEFHVPDYVQRPQYKAITTISVAELVNIGFLNWDESWAWGPRRDPNATEAELKIAARIEQGLLDRYWYREISLLPPGIWKHELTRKMTEMWRKYKKLYEIGSPDPMASKTTYGKSRDIMSDFPQTQLAGNEDYASQGHDREYEDIEIGDTIKKFKQFMEDYQDPDIMFLEELEPFFSCLYSTNMNLF